MYVSSSSTILLGQSEPNTYDAAYSPGYYNASLLSTASTSSSLYYESAKIRSIFYEGDENEAQEISLYVEGGSPPLARLGSARGVAKGRARRLGITVVLILLACHEGRLSAGDWSWRRLVPFTDERG